MMVILGCIFGAIYVTYSGWSWPLIFLRSFQSTTLFRRTGAFMPVPVWQGNAIAIDGLNIKPRSGSNCLAKRGTEMTRRTLPLSRVYRLLEPGPVVLVTTALQGKPNIMTMSWQTMMEFEPPLVGCVISGRNYSFDALVATRECVLNIPSVEMAKQVVGVGNCSGSKVDKFRKFKLTPHACLAGGTAAHSRVLSPISNARWSIRAW